MNSVYWKFHENFFISLSGKVLNFTKEEKIEISFGVLEENSAKNLMKLFNSESINSATNSPNDPLSSLVESLVRLGQISCIEKSGSGDNSDCYCYDVYFQSSVVIGGKREYPLYILRSENTSENVEIVELLKKLKGPTNFDEKSNVLNDFYIKNYQETAEAENFIFKEENIYESLYETDERIENMMKSLKRDGLKLSDLSTEEIEEIDLKELENIFNEMILTKIPSEKLSKLVKFHSNLTKKPETNADVLLPLLTHVLINLERGHEVVGQVKFIERYAHPINWTGINNYILTSTVITITKIESFLHFV